MNLNKKEFFDSLSSINSYELDVEEIQNRANSFNDSSLNNWDDLNIQDSMNSSIDYEEIRIQQNEKKAKERKLYEQQRSQKIEAHLTATFGFLKLNKQQVTNTVICNFCKEKINKLQLQQHEKFCEKKLEIEYQEVNCPYCGEQIIRAFISDHLEDCASYKEQQFKNAHQIQECSICMTEIKEVKVKLKCKHTFHKNCIQIWLTQKRQCPICRKKV